MKIEARLSLLDVLHYITQTFPTINGISLSENENFCRVICNRLHEIFNQTES